jgi:hypothetical protein
MEVPNSSVEFEDYVKKIVERVYSEPAYTSSLYSMLEFCREPQTLASIENEISSMPSMKNSLHRPEILFSWLLRIHALEEVPLASHDSRWCTTPYGWEALRICSPEERLSSLAATSESKLDVYRQLLEACLTPRSRMEVETLLRGNPLLEESLLSPSYFVGNLEDAGGLYWDGAWKTTPAGENFLRVRLPQGGDGQPRTRKP